MSLTGTKIVAIDDTASIRTFLRLSLEYEGAEYHDAGTAKEGLELCQKIKPDLVILDLGLPDEDGLTLLPKIKQTQTGDNPSVLVLTVRKGRRTINDIYEKGADSYLSKPFMVDDLLQLIEENIDKSHIR